MHAFPSRWIVLSITSVLLVAGAVIWAIEADRVPEWNVEEASPEEALLFAFDASRSLRASKFGRLQVILDKYPEFLDVVQEKTGDTLVYRAAEMNSAEMLLYLGKRGAKLDVKTGEGVAALHKAASKNYVAAAKALIDLGADINLLTDERTETERRSPLDIAAKNGAEGVVELLLQAGAKLDAHPPESSYPAIHFAMRTGWESRVDDVKFMSKEHRLRPDMIPDPGPIPATGNAAVIGLLVDAGANLKGRNFEGDQPLHVAIKRDQLETMKVLLTKYRDKIEVDGRGWGTGDEPGLTPLMTAGIGVKPREVAIHLAMIKLLKEYGADLTVKYVEDEFMGRRAYEMAIYSQSDPSIVAALAPPP